MDKPKEQNPWKWGFIYYNPDDSKVVVPKRTGIGLTFNFARPLSYVWMLGLFVVILLIRYFLKRLS